MNQDNKKQILDFFLFNNLLSLFEHKKSRIMIMYIVGFGFYSILEGQKEE